MLSLKNLTIGTKKYTYYIINAFIYLSYLGILFGVYIFDPKWLETVMRYLELIICLILIARFHPFRETNLEPYDQQLIFLSATLFLTNLGIQTYLFEFIRNGSKILDNKHSINDIMDSLRL